MASTRNASVKGTKAMIDMQDLQDVLNAFHQAAKRADVRPLNEMIQHFNDPSNPVQKLIRQHNAAVDLLATPPEAEA
jgi:hypothetical protein